MGGDVTKKSFVSDVNRSVTKVLDPLVQSLSTLRIPSEIESLTGMTKSLQT